MPKVTIADISASQDRRAGLNPDPRLASGIVFAAVAVVMLGLADLFTVFHSRISGAGALALTAGVVAGAGWSSRWIGALLASGLAWVFLNGFSEDRAGSLHWHGEADFLRLSVLAACAVIGAGARSRQIAGRRSSELSAAGFDTEFHSADLESIPTEQLVPFQRTTSPRGEQHA